MRFTRWATVVAMAGAALLSACGSGSTGNSQVRLLNASVGYSSLDLTANSSTINSAIAYGALGSYANVAVGANTSTLNIAGTSTVLTSPPLSGLAANTPYTVIAWGDAGAASTSLLTENQPTPASGQTSLLTLNLAGDSGTLDIYVVAPGTDITNVQPLAPSVGPGKGDAYRLITSGSYEIIVTAAGSKTDLRLDYKGSDGKGLLLDSTKINTLILTSASGGVMVNGLVLPQQGTAVTALQNGLAKARVISALPVTSSLSASVTTPSGSTAVLSNAGSPVISPYANVSLTAGNTATLNWSANSVNNGAAQTYSLTNLVASNTYGVLFWGDPTNPTITPILENNAIPTTLNTANMRVINGVAGLTNVSLYVNLQPVLQNVQPGFMSANYGMLTTNSPVVQVRNGATVLWTANILQTYNAGSVYTLLVSGNAANPVVTLVPEAQ